MGFCINCGQQQPGEQLLQRLRVEAQQIHNMRVQMQSQPQQGNPYQQRRW